MRRITAHINQCWQIPTEMCFESTISDQRD